ncbi:MULTISPECIES: hypothetical protein [Mycobacteriaceae]|uniref:LppI n=1 Tax=Mycolicibacterium neoaurum VKM Ac-1815D TaxID=700508 RepID=V5XCH9_MYCNE|nr:MULTISPECIES: hypothetical protein [Mycobacteriaceae]AHC25717.1 hypothetical protein D174_14475 [Mycolicibacterium neoaurum VKM Ac-1815D]AMO06148.1 hypothetical protein MyAD_14215 [Mycolicibacterium neoaurum]KJQ50352.1 hypothetical protein TS71_10220 [Mycolicibacterium neoaurum]KUM09516.1 hypothetical protein AVZ31_04745 [Mycolicibacterium neoaurum]
MRWMLVAATSVLVAGCSAGHGADTGRTPLTVAPKTTGSAQSSPRTTTPTITKPTTTTSTKRGVPSAGADLTEVIGWIEAGTAAPADRYATMARAGVTAAVDGVAFTTAVTNCVSTSRYRAGALACLVDLDDPPPRPPDAITVWRGDWVDFDGSAVEIGSVRGDPGPFRDGAGAALPVGDSLTFGDMRCRADTAALVCVNYAQRSAVRMAADGITGFGCLAQDRPPPGIGIRLSC